MKNTRENDKKWIQTLQERNRVLEEVLALTQLENKEVIEKLNEGLKDPEYRRGWIANIAMAQIDCERWYREENNKVGKYLNAKDRHAIANKGAEYFLELLSK